MVYVHDDPQRVREDDFDVSDTPMERAVHVFTLVCSCLFTIAVGTYLLTAPDDGLKLMMAMATGGTFIISLVCFFGVIMSDR